MRRFVLACSLVLTVSTSSLWAAEQKIACDTVPAPVRAGFEKAFASAAMKDCAKEVEKGKTTYEIISTEGETSRHVRLHADGRIMEVEEPVAIGSVPEPARQAVSKKYPKGEIALVEKVTREGQVSYEFQVKQGKKSMQMAVDENGKQVKLKSR